VPWEEFRPVLERVWRNPDAERKSRAGRKPMDAVLMFKTLVLSALYNLSDDQIEYQVRDRLSFMRFLGLGLEDRVPDAKTVWLYREALARAGLVEALFRQFDSYLARRGYIARGGQILDVERARATGSSVPARDRPGAAQPQHPWRKQGDQERGGARGLGGQARQAVTEGR
jgi:IS5 family transposase